MKLFKKKQRSTKKIDNLEPFDMILEDTVLVTSISYSHTGRITIGGFLTYGKGKDQTLKAMGYRYAD